MATSRLFPAGAAIALAGVVLVVVQTARALSGNTLGTIATVLLWVGVGLVAVGALLLTLSVVRMSPADADTAHPTARSDAVDLDGGQPADG